MLRPFRLHDLRLLQKLTTHCVPLNASLTMLNSVSPAQGALLHYTLRRNYPTYVWRPKAQDAEAFIQYQLSPDRTQARILWLTALERSRPKRAAAPHVDPEIWNAFLARLTIHMGDAGVQTMVAEVPENSPELEALKQAGFAIYTRQDIWKLSEPPVNQEPTENALQMRKRVDEWDIELLYSHLVPNMIRMVEPHPPLDKDGWVCHEGHELTAYAHVQTGTAAMRLRLLVSLAAETNADEIVRSLVEHKPPTAKLPLYCWVRNYQGWLQNPLRRNGFTHVGSQVVMVKHTVQYIKKPIRSLEHVLKANPAAQTSPIINKLQNEKEIAQSIARKHQKE